MKRSYESGESTNVNFFVGTEVENTFGKNQHTLFVVGPKSSARILEHASQENVSHIYLGANHSYNRSKGWYILHDVVGDLLKAEYTVSLNYKYNEHDAIKHELKDLYFHKNFIPQISLQFLDAKNESTNLNIKIDDETFDATNNGVWCIPFEQLIQDMYLTKWDSYSKDKILK